jgi:hypothetical protein
MEEDTAISFDAVEASIVLRILEKRAAVFPISEGDWDQLIQCEGYVRLKEREASIGTPLDNEVFRAFINNDALLKRREALQKTLDIWQQVDLKNVLARSRAYLPDGVPLRATIYPVIKPKPNSFVFDLARNPAIFLYLDPDIQQAQLENILAHELHHIGIGPFQIKAAQSSAWQSLPEAARRMLQWVGVFGEGIAMLAAAGGPDQHPNADSPVADRERWDHSMATFETDFREVEAFLLDVLEGRLNGQPMLDAGYRFFGIQGPWYTIGWKMAVTIENAFGRKAVIEAFCDPRRLLSVYNKAVAPAQCRWSEKLCLEP